MEKIIGKRIDDLVELKITNSGIGGYVGIIGNIKIVAGRDGIITDAYPKNF